MPRCLVTSDQGAALSELAEKYRLNRDQTMIDLLLDEHIDAGETLHRGVTLNVKTGSRAWGLDMPATWTEDHHHLAELLDCYHGYCKTVAIVTAKVKARQQGDDWAEVDWRHDYWHLAQWYLVCRRVQEPLYILDKSGKPRRDREGKPLQRVKDGQLQWTRRIVRRGEADQVLSGVRWLETTWEQRVRPRLGRGPQCVAWEKLLESAA
jgi:hypothetical protein